jgi:hypothetical protein
MIIYCPQNWPSDCNDINKNINYVEMSIKFTQIYSISVTKNYESMFQFLYIGIVFFIFGLASAKRSTFTYKVCVWLGILFLGRSTRDESFIIFSISVGAWVLVLTYRVQGHFVEGLVV